MEQIEVAVIGGGVTGLATARAIARSGRSVCVLERHARAGLDTSTHNSGVIHAGIYHPPGSLKSTLCVRGRHLMYEFCATHQVPHRRCGKLIVAANPLECEALPALLALGRANGVEELELVDASFVERREPHVRAAAAIVSPASGVVDAEAYVRALLRSAADAGVVFLPGSTLVDAEPHASGLVLCTSHEAILAGQVVNAAGLYADEVSALLDGEPFTIYPCRGEYAELTPARRHLVNALVYPLPHESGHGLGVHLVRTPGGEVWLGPTIHYQERKDDYEGGRLPVEAFLTPARRLLRDIELPDLRLSGSGIRAKLHPSTEPYADFLIRRDTRNPNVVHAAGIDSPGLTASLAVGELVTQIIADC
ncbi:MAG TPA: NAD(P)/FAD-dependent oxidoreductase [Vicinamibacterales bacterium]|nr:NAD(P)/FAD-dependent oxidoreductase [Vicinamibacterales bacterium]